MASSEQPRRQFVPVPIETTFTRFRKASQQSQARIRPNPELTPEPSPRNSPPSSPPAFPKEKRERRKFHPQLIETSRRSRRVGDHGPATRPADKTDITPYTNHIYSAKPKQARKKDGYNLADDLEFVRQPPSQRETQEEGFNGYLLDLAAKEAERQIEEAALAAFPNSHAREGGVAHFYFREGSGSDNSPEGTPPNEARTMPRPRRKSSNLGLNWWHKHMQEHAMRLTDERDHQEEAREKGGKQKGGGEKGGGGAKKGEEMEKEAIKDDQTTSSPLLHRTDSDLDRMEFDLPPDPMWTTTTKQPTADDGVPGPSHAAAASRKQQEPGRRDHNPFGRPFGEFRIPHSDLELSKLRKIVSPPMLGKELIFQRCPSPKLTKLETDHPFDHHLAAEKCRDASGQSGLWRGYCCRTESAGGCIAAGTATILMTPQSPATPREPCACVAEPCPIIEEPTSLWPGEHDDELVDGEGLWSADKQSRGEVKGGLHALYGVQRARTPTKERDEKISQEFDEVFVTQVYNYLSLGYPAMAREFDEELSRISLVSVEELRRDDAKQVAKGHLLEMKVGDDKCPRWMALRAYIIEWARQHPDLDSLDPLAWGVRERRGSWAI